MNKLKENYKLLYKKYGTSANAMQWADAKSQYRRFEILCQVSTEINSVIDIGCGVGELLNYLLGSGFKGKYLGIDFVEEFIEHAQNRYSDYPDIGFICADVANYKLPKKYDFVVLSGVFNNKMAKNEQFMISTINELFEVCKVSIAFNAMSTYVDYQDDHLYYADPLSIFDYCKKHLTRKITLRHDYLVKDNSIPFEYTMYLYK